MTINRIILVLIVGVILVLSVFSSVTFAQGGDSEKPSDKSQETSELLPPDVTTREDYLPEDRRGGLGFGYYFNLLISLVIVVALIFAVSYLFRYLFARLPSYAGREDFKIVSSLRISHQATIYVVRFADRIFVLGVTPQNISVISQVDDPDSVKDIVESMSETAGMVNPHAFSTLLGKRMESRLASEAAVEKEKRKKEQDIFEETLKRLEKYDDPGEGKKRR